MVYAGIIACSHWFRIEEADLAGRYKHPIGWVLAEMADRHLLVSSSGRCSAAGNSKRQISLLQQCVSFRSHAADTRDTRRFQSRNPSKIFTLSEARPMDSGLGSCHVRPSFAKSVIHDLRSFCHVLYRHRPKLAVHTPRRRIDSLFVRHQALVQLPLPSTCCGRLHQASEALLQATKGIVSQGTVDLGKQEYRRVSGLFPTLAWFRASCLTRTWRMPEFSEKSPLS